VFDICVEIESIDLLIDMSSESPSVSGLAKKDFSMHWSGRGVVTPRLSFRKVLTLTVLIIEEK
jgi:hypothetical protein